MADPPPNQRRSFGWIFWIPVVLLAPYFFLMLLNSDWGFWPARLRVFAQHGAAADAMERQCACSEPGARRGCASPHMDRQSHSNGLETFFEHWGILVTLIIAVVAGKALDLAGICIRSGAGAMFATIETMILAQFTDSPTDLPPSAGSF